MSLAREFWDFMKARKKFMLAPIIAVLVVLSGLLALAAGSQVLSPVIYMFW
jgi:hypothetical protein